jgi:hypothetical protein
MRPLMGSAFQIEVGLAKRRQLKTLDDGLSRGIRKIFVSGGRSKADAVAAQRNFCKLNTCHLHRVSNGS